MAIFKCKMCGGSLEISPDQHTAVCEYCGTEQTLPRLDDDRKANLYDRANHFRRNNDFDKAMGIYESILNEDSTDAETYWSLVLCRYGIEYVEDPATHKRIPTVNRVQFTSIFDDDDYKSALQYADDSQRRIYEEEAKTINEIQKGILAISQKEEPFDVFICYKETDHNGRRTPDSVLATDLYYLLKQEGFKVFFSRITLEDKLGSAYEPYIFAALNSAKVMVVLGTKPEHFNAVWVKNEWSRYLSIVKASKGKKALIPAYRDMDPYDLPEEFSHLQAQDMSKLGFMQDLIRGIKKITADTTPAEIVKETVILNQSSANTAPLLKRAFMFLEDRNWNSADEYCEKVLDIDPECAEAYLGELMADLHCSRREDLKNQSAPFDHRSNYGKVLRFADGKLKAELEDDIQYIYNRNEHERLDGIYQQAKSAMYSGNMEDNFYHAAELFQSIAKYEDAAVQARKCRELAETARKNAFYNSAVSQMAGEEISSYENAIQTFRIISGWKDADEKIVTCQNKIQKIREKEEQERLEQERQAELRRQEIREKEEQERLERERQAELRRQKTKKRNKIIKNWTVIICVCIAVVILLQKVIIPSLKLRKADALIESGDYSAAYELLEELDRDDIISENKYDIANSLIKSGDYVSAYKLLDGLNYQDSEEKLQEIKLKYHKDLLQEAYVLIESGDYDTAYKLLEELEHNDVIAENKYERANALIDSGDYVSAYELLDDLNYQDSEEKLQEIKPEYHKAVLQNPQVGNIVFFGTYEQDNDTDNGKEDIEWQVLDKKGGKILVISKYALGKKPYNNQRTNTTWESCTLRKWLNDDFLKTAFTEEEQQKIPAVTVSADKNPEHSTNPGSDTRDQIFLLSIPEVNKYFPSDNERAIYKTRWWLRTSGIEQDFAACVNTDGVVDIDGSPRFVNYGVRPALWINLES